MSGVRHFLPSMSDVGWKILAMSGVGITPFMGPVCAGSTVGPKIQHTHQGPTCLGQICRSRSKVKDTKVNNVKVPVFSLVLLIVT